MQELSLLGIKNYESLILNQSDLASINSSAMPKNIPYATHHVKMPSMQKNFKSQHEEEDPVINQGSRNKGRCLDKRKSIHQNLDSA